jgi:hypothetical protein
MEVQKEISPQMDEAVGEGRDPPLRGRQSDRARATRYLRLKNPSPKKMMKRTQLLRVEIQPQML